jgi:hypothetical protein
MVAAIPRLALTQAEAACALGVSVDYFQAHLAPELRAVKRGRKRIYPVRAIEAWLDRNAAVPLTHEK